MKSCGRASRPAVSACVQVGQTERKGGRREAHPADQSVERPDARVDKEARGVELVRRRARHEAEEGVGRRGDPDEEGERES